MVYHSRYKSFSCLIWGSYSSDDEEDSNQQGLNFISVQVVGFLTLTNLGNKATIHFSVLLKPKYKFISMCLTNVHNLLLGHTIFIS